MRGFVFFTWTLVLCLTGGLWFSPGVAAEGFLSLFRVDQGKSWAVDPSDFVKLIDAIEGREQVVKIANFGTMEILIPPKVENFGFDGQGAVHFQGRSIRVPKSIKGYRAPRAQLVSGSKIRFTLYTAPINRFLNSLSVRAVVPRKINGQPFVLNTAPLVAVTYPAPTIGESDLVIAVTLPSELEAPSSVDGESLQDAILAIPGLPRGLKSQFANVAYGGEIIITPDGIGEPVQIKPGVQGAFTTGPKTLFKGNFSLSEEGKQFQTEIQKSLNQKNLINGLWGMRFWADCLVWMGDGLIYMVMGELSQAEALEIARMVG
ncbi:MAG: hypothetical protein H0Z38_09590 [Firmicutes bacterium]|nr:hypothetical protein [Bacillota bacterium]